MENDDYPPTFRSLKEMEAWDEGIEEYEICSICGEDLTDGYVSAYSSPEGWIRICQSCRDGDMND